MNEEELKKQEAEIVKKWEEAIAQAYAPLKDTHTRREFTFSAQERRQISELTLIQKFSEGISKSALSVINDLLNLYILPRVGIKPNEQIRLFYDAAIGRFVVCEPKVQPLEATAEAVKPSTA